MVSEFPTHPKQSNDSPIMQFVTIDVPSCRKFDLLVECCLYLVVLQQRSPLLICRHNRLISANTNLLAEDTWDCDKEGEHKQSSHDREGEDPLECDDLGEKLSDTERGCEVAKSEAHSIVLEDNKEEQAIHKNTPDCNIGQDPCWQRMRMNSNSTIPIQCNESPSQWSRDDWDMDQSRVGVMAEI